MGRSTVSQNGMLVAEWGCVKSVMLQMFFFFEATKNPCELSWLAPFMLIIHNECCSGWLGVVVVWVDSHPRSSQLGEFSSSDSPALLRRRAVNLHLGIERFFFELFFLFGKPKRLEMPGCHSND